MPSMWQKWQDPNPSHSVLETEILVINIDVPAPKWFMVNHQSTPLFAQVAVSVAVKNFYASPPKADIFRCGGHALTTPWYEPWHDLMRRGFAQQIKPNED